MQSKTFCLNDTLAESLVWGSDSIHHAGFIKRLHGDGMFVKSATFTNMSDMAKCDYTGEYCQCTEVEIFFGVWI